MTQGKTYSSLIYTAILQQQSRTNISEGWHNSIQTLVGRKHPSLYSFKEQLITEQTDIELMIL